MALLPRKGAYGPYKRRTPKGPAFEPCKACIGGWITVWDTRDGFKAMPKVTRCSCWLTHQKKLEAQASPSSVSGHEP